MVNARVRLDNTAGAITRISAESTPRAGARLRAPLNALAIAVAIAVLGLHLLVWVKAIEARGGPAQFVRGIDFMATMTGARVIRDGDGASLYDVETQRAAQLRVRAPFLGTSERVLLPYIHPPFEAVLLAPLIDLPYTLLYALATLAAIICVGAALWIMARALPIPASTRGVVLLLACSFSPMLQALWLGQTSPYMLLGWCGAYALYKRRRDLGSGGMLALLALKPLLLPIPALLFVLRWRWRAVAGLIAVVLGASVAVMPLLGFDWIWRQWSFLTAIASVPDRNAIFPEAMPTFRGLVHNLLAGSAPAPALPLEVGLGIITVGLLLLAWWRSRGLAPAHEEGAATDLLWALGCIVALLVSPHLGPHDHTVLLFPLWIVAAYLLSGRWTGWVARSWLILLWACYLISPVSMLGGLSTGTTTTVRVLTLVAMAGLLVWLLVSEARFRVVADGHGGSPQLSRSE